MDTESFLKEKNTMGSLKMERWMEQLRVQTMDMYTWDNARMDGPNKVMEWRKHNGITVTMENGIDQMQTEKEQL